MLPPEGSIRMGADYREHLSASGSSPGRSSMPQKETPQPPNAAVERTWHIGQSRPDSGLGLQVKALRTFPSVPGSGQAHRCCQQGLASRGGVNATLPGDNIRENGPPRKWTPLKMLPESGSIPRKLTKYLPSTRLQGGSREANTNLIWEHM